MGALPTAGASRGGHIRRSTVILHMARSADWRAALGAGVYRCASLDGEGFIHCSTGRQVRRPLRALFAGVTDLLMLAIDESRLGAEVHYEEAEPAGDRFPHVYGPIPVAAVLDAVPVPVEAAGYGGLPERLAMLLAAARGREPAGHEEWRMRGHVISTERARLNRARVHAALTASYWEPGISRAVVDAAIDGSECFGLYTPDGAQAGFGRLVTDFATYGYLCDVVVFEEHRGRGLGVFLVASMLEHPRCQGLRTWILGTRDAHGLYARFGFATPADPTRVMQLSMPPAFLYGPPSGGGG